MVPKGPLKADDPNLGYLLVATRAAIPDLENVNAEIIGTTRRLRWNVYLVGLVDASTALSLILESLGYDPVIRTAYADIGFVRTTMGRIKCKGYRNGVSIVGRGRRIGNSEACDRGSGR